jgi:4-amino-4-deoxy-L-arabinose transferase-like glycosyltransferase
MALSTRRLAIAILLAALAIRVAWVFATPDYRLVHDALDYNRHAISIANGDGFALSYGRPTAFRPPAYPIFLAGVYWIFGPSLEWARLANALVGTGIVGLIGVIAFQVWGKRVGLIAMALAAVYIPLILVGQSVMSEPLFVLCLLGAIACAIRRWPLAAGVLMGLAVLGRANALILLLPLAWAVCRQVSPQGGDVPRAGKGPKPALIMLVACALTVVPWTIRNYLVLDHFVPVSTQLGSALAGTYNSEAMNNKENPAAWMSLKRVDDYRPIFNRVRETNEAVLEKELRSASLEYIKDHPGSPLKVAYWTTRRMLDLAGWDWAIHTAGTVSAGKRAGAAGIICFWIFAILAIGGAFTKRAREAPLWLWAVPVLMYLGVVFLVVETPRYRMAIDPFVIMLAALALSALTTKRAKVP